jgi:hypothetical protein
MHKDHTYLAQVEIVPAPKPEEVPGKKKRGRKRKYPKPDDHGGHTSSGEDETLDQILEDEVDDSLQQMRLRAGVSAIESDPEDEDDDMDEIEIGNVTKNAPVR